MEHGSGARSCDISVPIQVLITSKSHLSCLRPSQSLTNLPSLKPCVNDSSSSFQQRVKEMRHKGASVVRGLARWESLLAKAPQHDITLQILPLSGVRPLCIKHKLNSMVSSLRPKVAKQLLKKSQTIQKLNQSIPQVLASPVTRRKRMVCSCTQKYFRQTDLHIRGNYPVPRQALSQLQCLYAQKTNGRELTLAIVFDGVLGDIWKPCLTDTSPKCLYLRRNAEAGLDQLQGHFNLVLVTFLSSKKTYRMLSYFRTQHISFQAAYFLPKDAPRDIVDYSKVITDLELAPQQLLVVTSLDLSYEDLLTSDEVLYVRAGRKLRLTAKGLPLPGTTTFLLPSIRAQEKGNVLPFTRAAEAILKLGQMRDWTSIFHCPANSHLTLFSTSVIQEVALERTLPHPSAHFIRKYQEKCHLHNSLKWLSPASQPCNQVILFNTKPERPISTPAPLEIRPLKLSTGCLSLLHFTQSRIFQC